MSLIAKFFFLVFGILFSHNFAPVNMILMLCTAILFVLSDVLPKEMQPLCHLVFFLMFVLEPEMIVFLPLFVYDLFSCYEFYSVFALVLWIFSERNPYIITLSIFALYLACTQIRADRKILSMTVLLDNVREKMFADEEKFAIYHREKRNEIEIAVLNERNRIAREIHDSVGHALSSCILQTEVLKLQNSDPHQSKVLDTLQQTLQTGMYDIRSSLHNLHDSSLNLKHSMEGILSSLPLQISLDFASNSEMNYSMKLGILSALKEILANVAKHSDAEHVRVQFLEHKEYYSLSVKDDGNPPVSKNPKHTGGMGLLSIADFTRHHAGNLYYGFEEDGFFVHITLRKEQLS